ncbi:hypothetical protein LCGC14_2111370, partial [marine sediment metagenome]
MSNHHEAVKELLDKVHIIMCTAQFTKEDLQNLEKIFAHMVQVTQNVVSKIESEDTMGMFTELHFNVELRKDTPKEVIEMLKYMTKDKPAKLNPDVTIDHPLFKTDRWRFMLVCDSYYFNADTHTTLRFDKISNTYYLCIRCNLKNYDSEIEKFIDWIRPYLADFAGDFLGF